MIETGTAHLTAEKARSLLRKLRDLNLSSGPVAVNKSGWVKLAGCLSLDAPVEKGVRYRVAKSDGIVSLLEIAWTGSTLEVVASQLDVAHPVTKLDVGVTCDRKGRACAKALGARVHPESCDRRELEHFLRRVVKTLFR